MIGKTIAPILRDTADVILDYNVRYEGVPLDYPDDSLMDATLIFNSVIQERFIAAFLEDNNFDEVCELAENLGVEIRELILKYTKIDMREVYK